jgi:NNP family nitrate/nitrite transporter-like MFS transporter
MTRQTDSFWKVGHWPTLLSAFLYFDVSFMVWVLLGALGNYVADQFALSLGIMVALLFVVMACLGMGNGSVFQLVPQRFKDRVGVATGILGAAGGLGGFFLPTLLGGLKQSTDSYGSGLMVFAGFAALALVCLGIAQRGWIDVWIAKHGRVRPAGAPVLLPERAEPA